MSLKVATFNVEWMVSLFSGDWNDWDGTIPEVFEGKRLGSITLEAIDDVHALCNRIAGVIDAVNPDILGLQEGPPRDEQMQLFVDTFLGGRYKVFGSNRQWQKNYILVRNELAIRVMHEDPGADPFKAHWQDSPYYPWGMIAREDRKLQDMHRRPAVIRLAPEGGVGPALEIVSVHTKSKFSRLKTRDQWENREPEAVLDALTVRQKLSAEAAMLRAYFVHRMAQEGPEIPFILMGDFNDGPLAEALEREFLIHNIIDDLVGSVLAPEAVLRHAMTPDQILTSATTRFRNPLEGGRLTEELIDHILISPGLITGTGPFTLEAGSCQVEKDAFETFNDEPDDHEDRNLRPSDHLPVSATIQTQPMV